MKAKPSPQPAQRRGLIEVEIGGRVRHLKFGMLTLLTFGQLQSTTPSPDDFDKHLVHDEVQALVQMTYCGLLARKQDNDLPSDFSLEMTAEWIDDLSLAEWSVIQGAILEAMASGNGPKPPQTPRLA